MKLTSTDPSGVEHTFEARKAWRYALFGKKRTGWILIKGVMSSDILVALEDASEAIGRTKTSGYPVEICPAKIVQNVVDIKPTE